MRKRSYRWHDKDVKKWARAYTRKRSETLATLESSLGVSHSTLWWCFVHRLEGIDEGLYVKAMDHIVENKAKGGRKA